LRTHEEYKEMTAAHALGALDEAEARELEAHLKTCAECRAESRQWEETAAALVYAVPPVEPSAEVRSRIFASVRNEGRAPAALPVAFAEDAKPKAREATRARANVVEFERPARRGWSTASKFGALAASLAFIALALSLILLWNRYNEMQQRLAQLSDQLAQSQGDLSRERETLAREREAKELIAAPEARILALTGTELATRARAKFVYDRQTGRAMLMADDLPPAPAGKAYQLWFIAEGKPPMPGHVFNTDASGHAEMRDQMPVEAREATTFAVTLEPAAGVPAPTGAKYLLGADS
jgi:anti-sigma-K factor RskA